MLAKLKEWWTDQQARNHQASQLRSIKKYGWTGVSVLGDSGGIQEKEFTYTVGFSDFDAPELIVFTLAPGLTNFVFWELFNSVRAGLTLEDGMVFRPEVPELDGFECTLRSAVRSEIWSNHGAASVGYSRMQGRTARPPVMQVVWPSAENGKYPWTAGCPATVIESQPVLYETRPSNERPVFGRRT